MSEVRCARCGDLKSRHPKKGWHFAPSGIACIAFVPPEREAP